MPGPSNIPIQNKTLVNLSDDKRTVDLTSSDEDSDNLSDTDSWCDISENIPDFSFDASRTGIQIDIPETARNNPVKIFKLLWSKEIFDIIVESTNNNGKNGTNKYRPHTKNARKSSFNNTDVEEMKKFLGICVLLGNVKFL